MKGPGPKPLARFTMRVKSTTLRVRVCVWPRLADMYAGTEALNAYRMRSGRALAIWHNDGSRLAYLHLGKRCLGTEVIAHESSHLAHFVLSRRSHAVRFRRPEEGQAFWTGQFARTLVGELRERGFYD